MQRVYSAIMYDLLNCLPPLAIAQRCRVAQHRRLHWAILHLSFEPCTVTCEPHTLIRLASDVHGRVTGLERLPAPAGR